MKFNAEIRFQWHDMSMVVEADSEAEAEAKIREEHPEAGHIHLWSDQKDAPAIDYLKN